MIQIHDVPLIFALIFALVFATGYAPTLDAGMIVDGGFENGAHGEVLTLGWPTEFGRWVGDFSAYSAGELGISPFEGNRMLRFIGTRPDMNAGLTVGSQIFQLVDLSPIQPFVRAGAARVESSAWFNRVAGDSKTDTQFGIRITALTGVPDDFLANFDAGNTLGQIFGRIQADSDPDTWEHSKTTMNIPHAADYLSFEIIAEENVFNDTTLPEFDGHFGDAFTVKFDVVPEPGSLAIFGIGALGLGVAGIRRRKQQTA